MKKILIVSTVSRQFYLFEKGNIEVLHSLGYEVHGAANYEDANERLDGLNFIRHHIDIQRSPYSKKNVIAYRQLKKIMRTNHFDAIHCHSPMGGVLGRLAARAAGIKSVIYTAHGFHFYEGAPLNNWLLYYPVERLLSRYTDTLITINHEDYNRAKKFKKTNAFYVPGVGIDLEKIKNVNIDQDRKREELGIPKESFLITTVGELNDNKNHEIIIHALSQLQNKEIHYVICGTGDLESKLIELSEDLGIAEQVHLLGFRNDIHEINKASDLFVFPSFREGLPVSVMEAMATGLPVIASNIRGNSDLIDEEGGYLIPPQNADIWTKKILSVYKLPVLQRLQLGEYNEKKVENYNLKNVLKHMMEIYKHA